MPKKGNTEKKVKSEKANIEQDTRHPNKDKSIKSDSRFNWFTAIPPEVTVVPKVIKFKLSPEDVGKRPDDVFKFDSSMLLIFLSLNSYWNGLIVGDRVIRVNSATKREDIIAELMKGGECTVEVKRRKGAVPATKERMRKHHVRPYHSYFVLNLEKPPNKNTPRVGMTVVIIKSKAEVTVVTPDEGVAAKMIGAGDRVLDMNCCQLPFTDHTGEFFKDQAASLCTTGKLSLLVERPVEQRQMYDHAKYLYNTGLMKKDEGIPMAKDAATIGHDASLMHKIVLKKLTTPSILSSDVHKAKKINNNKTSEAATSSVRISTASTEMKINTDVEDPDDLKAVQNKSHAVGRNSDGGDFDDE